MDGALLEDAAFCTRCGVRVPPRAEGDACIGSVVGGRYRILGVVGEGGMGTVYEAEQALGTEVRRVAVKVLRKDSATTPDVLQRFRRECGTASKLVHPNAVAIHDFGTTDSGELYIAMDLVAGKPLSQLIAAGAVSPARALLLLGQICEVVDEAHALGIVHRDLKPDNIIVATDRHGREIIKILDFGIALPGLHADGRCRTRLTLMGTIMGTPAYMSPEQFLGGAVDARSDVYSLGIVAYELLAGRRPFHATELIAWATQHMTVTAPPLPDTAAGVAVPSSFRVAIAGALAKEPAERPQTARAFYDQLSSLVGPSSGRMSATIFAGPAPASALLHAPAAHSMATVAVLPQRVPSLPPDTASAREPAAIDMPVSSWGLRAAIIAAVIVAGGALSLAVIHFVGPRQAESGPEASSLIAPTTAAPTVTVATSATTTTTSASSDIQTTTPLKSTAPSAGESAPPLARPRLSTCAAIAMASDCVTIAALKPRCASADPFNASALARCQGLCAAVCPAPQRRR